MAAADASASRTLLEAIGFACVTAMVFGAGTAATAFAALLAVHLAVARAPATWTAFLVATIGAAVFAAAVAPVFAAAGVAWDYAASVFAVLALGAPGLVLDRLAPQSAVRGWLMVAALPGLVLAAWAGGLTGACAAMAGFMLAAPFFSFGGPHKAQARRGRLALAALGVLAAAFTGLAIFALAAAAAGEHAAALLPAGVLAALAFAVALRLHAPWAARRLARVGGERLRRVLEAAPSFTPARRRSGAAFTHESPRHRR